MRVPTSLTMILHDLVVGGQERDYFRKMTRARRTAILSSIARPGAALRWMLLALLISGSSTSCSDSGTPVIPPPAPPPPPPPPPPPGIPDTVDRLGQWTIVLDRTMPSKYEGLVFPDDQHGWLISDQGDILASSDGGNQWSTQAAGLGHLRSLDFVSPTLGFAGTLGGVMYRTEDGGTTWTDITDRFPTRPIGFCGIAHFGSTIHAVGRYANATDYYRSVDGGATWTFSSFGATAQGLVDVVFTGPQVGFIGGRANTATSASGSAIIYKTTDGGTSWRPVFVGNYGAGWAWKIFPATSQILYAALASTDGTYRVGKSVDGGETWSVQIVATSQPTGLRSGIQGIGFLDQNVGWVGGFYGGMHATTNGGATWHPVAAPGELINRFRKVGNTMFTASTAGVLRYVPR